MRKIQKRMNIRTLFIIFVGVLTLMACGDKRKEGDRNTNLAISYSKPAEGDSTLYGLACPGCTDSAVIVLPDSGGDPVKYDILRATKKRRVYGGLKTGDWIGVVPDNENPAEAYLVIDLDDLKGTWTYSVMPSLRDVTGLSKRQQERILAQMPDSIVETYMVPREYGFTLKRQSQARSVGFVMQSSTATDDSPVVYPEVPNVSEWHVFNGRLILTRKEITTSGDAQDAVTYNDTLQFVFLRDDSLVLRSKDGSITGYHRRKDAASANAAARAANKKQEEAATRELNK